MKRFFRILLVLTCLGFISFIFLVNSDQTALADSGRRPPVYCASCIYSCYLNNPDDGTINGASSCESGCTNVDIPCDTNVDWPSWGTSLDAIRSNGKKDRATKSASASYDDYMQAYGIRQAPKVYQDSSCLTCLDLHNDGGLQPYSANKTCIDQGSCHVIPGQFYSVPQKPAAPLGVPKLTDTEASAPQPDTLALNNFNSFQTIDGGFGFSAANNHMDINGYIKDVIQYGGAVLGGLAVLKIIFGGVMYATAAGNPQRISDAKSHILYALLGVALIAGANIILWLFGASMIH